MQSFINTARHVNWIDVLCVILFIRVLYIAFKSGFVLEFFKLIGTVLAVYLATHYCSSWAQLFVRPFGPKNQDALYITTFLAFVILALIGYVIGFLLRVVFSKMLTIEAHPALNKWGGIICGAARSVLATSLIIFTLTISPSLYLNRKTAVSYIGSKVVSASPFTYRVLWSGLLSKLMPHEHLNTAVLESSRNALAP